MAVRETGHRCAEGETLIRLGDSHRSAGNVDAARDAWGQALTILTRLGHPAADQLRVRLDVRDRELTVA